MPELSRLAEDQWNGWHVRGGILWIVRFWGAVTGILFLVVFAWFMLVSPPKIGSTRENLVSFMKDQAGLSVNREDLVVAGGLRPGFGAPVYRVVFLGVRPAHGFRELYLARVRISARGVPVGLESMMRLSDIVDHHIEQAAVSEEWVVWVAPGKPGFYSLVFLPDPEKRWDLIVEPSLENPVVFFDGIYVVVAGRHGGSGTKVRVDLKTGAVKAPENLMARLVQSKT